MGYQAPLWLTEQHNNAARVMAAGKTQQDLVGGAGRGRAGGFKGVG